MRFFKERKTPICPSCVNGNTFSAKTNAFVSDRIQIPPRTLQFRFRRVHRREKRNIKVRTPIVLPTIIDVSRFVHAPEKKTHHIYKLSAVIIHSGRRAKQGHYSVLVKNSDVDQWYLFNDRDVVPYGTDEDVGFEIVSKDVEIAVYSYFENAQAKKIFTGIEKLRKRKGKSLKKEEIREVFLPKTSFPVRNTESKENATAMNSREYSLFNLYRGKFF